MTSSRIPSSQELLDRIKDLEQQFDVQLFDRVGKRLQANELGRLLRPKAEALLQDPSALVRAMATQFLC